MEKLANAVENGTRDAHADTLINEVSGHFEKCQELLNSISGSINSNDLAVEGQKQRLEENKNLLKQRSNFISKYKASVEELLKSEP